MTSLPKRALAIIAALIASVSIEAAERSIYDRPAIDRIAFALYTVHNKTLKLTAQFYPIHDHEPFRAELQVLRNTDWITVDAADIAYPGLTAAFRVDDWDDRRSHPYRVRHNGTAFYKGTVQANPHEQDEFVVAALSCNSTKPAHGGDLSKADIVANLTKVKPDLLFFAGDQVYDHSLHYYYWLQFGRDFGDLLRNTPTVCLPDDHDVGQANLWGASGIRCAERDGQAGGYYMPPEYVKEVERAQTSHLPDPFDPTPVHQGIGVYYTHLNWGGVSFAILEDRKFKSGPGPFKGNRKGRADSITEPGYEPRDLDAEEAVLLGDRQLRFLEHWVTDWRNADMKCVLSQTAFAQTCNYSGSQERELLADFDSNGWPQSGRNRALSVIRKGFACHLAGDQHLGTVVQHGLDEWGDASYGFATPAIANYWLRWWDPKQPGGNRRPGAPWHTGDFLDGFGNKITMHAAANPTATERQAEGKELSTRAAGFGLIRFNKPKRTITFECWPRNVDITDPSAEPYEGWPITISQADNFPQRGKPELPKLRFREPSQVVSVYDKAGRVVSSLRTQGDTYQPRTPEVDSYRVVIGEEPDGQWSRTLTSTYGNRTVIDVVREAP
ncbi:hypothetical protein [Botrimarina hoheduenensis]|uniref:PhoD-like phosphatase n=1 Tax=Botrimarina hoheduenensis TaxID=2528000 RepID=A0A5C5VR86_9BACT|nr:hypothetical protein [Botrimarina hoheduenensis]TWT40670.1 hypothetical protein Pla111_33150 [Botrimarina hoheduenensis]